MQSVGRQVVVANKYRGRGQTGPREHLCWCTVQYNCLPLRPENHYCTSVLGDSLWGEKSETRTIRVFCALHIKFSSVVCDGLWTKVVCRLSVHRRTTVGLVRSQSTDCGRSVPGSGEAELMSVVRHRHMCGVHGQTKKLELSGEPSSFAYDIIAWCVPLDFGLDIGLIRSKAWRSCFGTKSHLGGL